MVGRGLELLDAGAAGFCCIWAGTAGLAVGAGAVLLAGTGVEVAVACGLFEAGSATSAVDCAGTVGGKAGPVGEATITGWVSTGRLAGLPTSVATLILLATS